MYSLPLISILTPCYNNAHLIHRLLDSVLSQTYPNLEMIVIDDGSTDNIAEVINQYIPKFKARGNTLVCARQENSGLSATIKAGLKLIKGEFLLWPDADDWYASDEAVEKMYRAFVDSGENVGMVRCLAYGVNEKTLKPCREYGEDKEYSEDQFENCLFCKDYWFPPINFLVKTSVFFENVPEGDIYTEKRAGQNWQMTLPTVYKKRYITLRERLCYVLERTNSLSRPKNESFESRIEQINAYENTIFGTLDRMAKMPARERDFYKHEIAKKYAEERYKLSIRKNKKDAQKVFKTKLEELGVPVNWKWEFCSEHFYLCRVVWFALRVVSKIKRIVLK